MLTLVEIMERLKMIDETSLLEILDIHSDEIVERFADKIEERYDSLAEEFQTEESN
jgi:hypothetical protein